MSKKSGQNLEAELAFQKELASRIGEILPTPQAKMDEIRRTPSWRIDPRQYMYRQIHILDPKSILVAGCGGGETAVRLARLGYDVTAFDLSPDFVKIARRRSEVDGVGDNLRLSEGDATRISFPPEQFDLILFELILHHVPIPETLANLAPSLRKDGHILVFEPISLSPLLERFRNALPVPKEVSENERQLGPDDLACLVGRFELVDDARFVLTSRLRKLLARFLGQGRHIAGNTLARLDSFLFLALPFLKKYAATTVLIARKKETSPQD